MADIIFSHLADESNLTLEEHQKSISNITSSRVRIYNLIDVLGILYPDYSMWEIPMDNYTCQYANLIWKSTTVDKPTESTLLAKQTELNNAEMLRVLRVLRNEKLKEYDWLACSDVSMTQAQKDYRQALRDVPQNISNGSLAFPTIVDNKFIFTWPTPP